MKHLMTMAMMGVLLTSCQSGDFSRHYSAKAVNSAGNVVSKTNISSNKEGIDMSVQTLCKANRTAKHVIVENRLGQQVDGSPFKCR